LLHHGDAGSIAFHAVIPAVEIDINPIGTKIGIETRGFLFALNEVRNSLR
jgi:hypothetical protein